MSSICRYCNNTELIFDNAHKSKSGKLIPLDKASGLPHNCPENPYYNKGQSTNGNNYTSTSTVSNENATVSNESATITTDVLLNIKLLNQKVDKLLEMVQGVK